MGEDAPRQTVLIEPVVSHAYTILIVANADLRAGLSEQFALQPAFALLQAQTPDEALALLRSAAPDLLLVDDALPADGAAGLVAAARAAGFAGRMVALSSQAQASIAGVDDCVQRPFRFADLVTRLHAVLRAQARAEPVAVGPYVFHIASQRLVDSTGGSTPLTEKETAILARLARAKGAAVARDVLLRDVWGYSPSVTTRTLETHIHRLRRKIETDPAQPRLLVTEQGGYRLTVAEPLARAD